MRLEREAGAQVLKDLMMECGFIGFFLFTDIICIYVINFRSMGDTVSNETNKVYVPWNLQISREN